MGEGFATEGSIAVLRKGFREWGLLRVVERLGVTFVRAFFEHWPEYVDGAEFGDVEYELTRERSAGHGDR